MKKANKRILLLGITMLLISLSSAADPQKTKPRSNEVVLVSKFKISPLIDNSFFHNYKNYSGGSGFYLPPGKEKTDDIQHPVYLCYIKLEGSQDYIYTEKYGTLGDFCFLKIDIPKDRVIKIEYVAIYLFDNQLLNITLPIYSQITIPEKSNYIYLGTFNYVFADEFFTISSASKIDEFDAAAVQLSKLYGPDAKLYRANLTAIEEEKK